MTNQYFSELKIANPLINELCNALGLDLDVEYYNHPDREKERLLAERKAQFERGVALANEYLGKRFWVKTDLFQEIEKRFVGKGEAVISYWLRNKIVSEGFAVFGTKKQERKEIVFLGDCPY
jgi:hypothetical protein